jgi:hypothetical protein
VVVPPGADAVVTNGTGGTRFADEIARFKLGAGDAGFADGLARFRSSSSPALDRVESVR